MCPNEAVRVENHASVLAHQAKYAKEFRGVRRMELFREGDAVLIRNEHKSDKRDDESREEGLVEKCLGHDRYRVKKFQDGATVERHALQLRAI